MTPLQILLSLIGALLLLVTMPLALELLVLTAAAALPTPRRKQGSGTAISLHVIVPAHNEEKLISACVRSIVENSSANVRVFVVAHNCSDATAERAEMAGATVLRLDDTVGGKGTALHHAFTHAQAHGADAVLVIDADSVVSPNLTAAVCKTLASGADALQCRYQVANISATPRTRLVALAFAGMNVLRPRGRHRLGFSCGIFGNGFALSGETLAKVPYLANSVVEDLEYHLHLVEAGRRVHFLDRATVFGEMPASDVGSATQRARWEGGRMLMRRQWTGPMLQQLLHGKLRMAEPLLDILSLPLASGTVLLAGSLAVALAGHLHWLTAYSVCGLLAVAAYTLVSALFSPEPSQTIRALGSVPAYVLFKILLYPKTRLAARRDAAWVRTQRNS